LIFIYAKIHTVCKQISIQDISRTANRDGLHTEFYSVSLILYNVYSSIEYITGIILLKIPHGEKFDTNLWIFNKKL